MQSTLKYTRYIVHTTLLVNVTLFSSHTTIYRNTTIVTFWFMLLRLATHSCTLPMHGTRLTQNRYTVREVTLRGIGIYIFVARHRHILLHYHQLQFTIHVTLSCHLCTTPITIYGRTSPPTLDNPVNYILLISLLLLLLICTRGWSPLTCS